MSNDYYYKKVQEKLKEIRETKEEIITAFLAKYNAEPDELEIVEETHADKIIWYVRKRRKE